MIFTDRVGIGGTITAPTVTLRAHVGHERELKRAGGATVIADELQVMIAAHPAVVPGAALHWNGKTYTIGQDVKTRRRGEKTHHLTLSIVSD